MDLYVARLRRNIACYTNGSKLFLWPFLCSYKLPARSFLCNRITMWECILLMIIVAPIVAQGDKSCVARRVTNNTGCALLSCFRILRATMLDITNVIRYTKANLPARRGYVL